MFCRVRFFMSSISRPTVNHRSLISVDRAVFHKHRELCGLTDQRLQISKNRQPVLLTTQEYFDKRGWSPCSLVSSALPDLLLDLVLHWLDTVGRSLRLSVFLTPSEIEIFFWFFSMQMPSPSYWAFTSVQLYDEGTVQREASFPLTALNCFMIVAC